MDWDGEQKPEVLERCMESVDRALELDPNEPETHRIMGFIKFFGERDFDLGRYHFEKARELCPSDVFIICRYAQMLNFCGEYEKALVELERAKRLDPFSNDLVFGPLALCHYWLGNNDEAIEIFKTIKILNWHLFYLAAIYLKTGEKELAKEKLKEAKAVSGMDINQFIDTQPYTKEELVKSLRDILKAIDV